MKTCKPHGLTGIPKSEETKRKLSISAKIRYANGFVHPRLGKKLSEDTKERFFRKENNPSWKGDKVSYKNLHRFLRRNFPPPSRCNRCKREAPRIELSNITGIYKRDIMNFEYLCRSCHAKEDKKNPKRPIGI